MKLHLNNKFEAFVSRIDTCVVIGEQEFAVECPFTILPLKF